MRQRISVKYPELTNTKLELTKNGGAVMSQKLKDIFKGELDNAESRGRQEGILQNMIDLAKKHLLAEDVAARELNMPLSEFNKLLMA